jgi:hypothetical protein
VPNLLIAVLERPLLSLASRDVAAMCPNSDSDVRALRQDMFRTIETLKEQIKWLGQRLLRAELRLKGLEAERQRTLKKFSDPWEGVALIDRP